jgi:hypothetical protein
VSADDSELLLTRDRLEREKNALEYSLMMGTALPTLPEDGDAAEKMPTVFMVWWTDTY